MINHLEGKIVEITPTYVVIDCNGIGYTLNISLHTFSAIGNLKTVKLLTHITVNQMDYTQVAYGFIDEDERSMTRTVLMIVRRALLQRKQRNYIPGPDGLLSEVTK
jgi:Holliday junction DNA helicase RuvA